MDVMHRAQRWVLTIAASVPLSIMTSIAAVPAAAAPTAHQAGNYRVIDLGSPGGGYGGAIALNERGDVVGYSTGPDEVLHPFLWRNGAMHSVGPDGLGLPVDINNHGDVLAVTDAA